MKKIVLILFISIGFLSQAQNIDKVGEKNLLKINGGLNYSGILYNANGIKARRDPYSWFLSGNLNFSILDWNIPFTYTYSNQHGTYTQPFNQYGLTPQYKWAKGYAGFASMNFSSYTLAGHVFLGGGLELTPKNWKIALMCGRLNKPIAYDAVHASDATMSYKRIGYGAKAGYEKGGYALHLIIFHAYDDPGSIPFIPDNTQVLPMNNTVVSLLGKAAITKHFSVDGEYAISGLTRNVLSKEDIGISQKNYLPLIFKMHSTSQFFDAYKSSVGYFGKSYSIKLQYERVAPDYKTLGAYFFNNDLENITLMPTLSLFKSKLNLSANAGFQRNDLHKEKQSATRRLVNSFTASFAPNQKLNFSASYSNFSTFTKLKPQTDPFFKNSFDTLNFYQVSQSANTAVNYNFGGTKMKQSVSLTGSYQVSGEKNGNNKSIPSVVYNANAGYNMSWVPTKTTGTIGFNFNRNELSTMNTIYLGPTINAGQSFLKNTMRGMLGATYNRSLTNKIATSSVMNIRAGINYTPTVKNKKYGKPTIGINSTYLSKFKITSTSNAFSELTTTINLSYSF